MITALLFPITIGDYKLTERHYGENVNGGTIFRVIMKVKLGKKATLSQEDVIMSYSLHVKNVTNHVPHREQSNNTSW